MLTAAIVVVGFALGASVAYASIPRVSKLATGAATVLLIAAAAVVFSLDRSSLLNALLLVVATLSASVLTGGYLWSRTGMDPSRSYWGWVYLGVRAPGRVRDAFVQLDTDEDLTVK